jgi:hypothetical protein
MDAPVPDTVLSRLAKLRRELEGELKRFVKRRSGLERQLRALGTRIESRQRALKLLEATERQLAAQGQGQPDLEGWGTGVGGETGASKQVRGVGGEVAHISELVWLI